jgi:hypothetical protein
MTVCHRGRQERRSIPAKKEMRKCSWRTIRAGLNSKRFKPITKLWGWLLTRSRAITPLAHFHATINRHQASIRIKAKREEEANKDKSEQFGEGSHNRHSTM